MFDLYDPTKVRLENGAKSTSKKVTMSPYNVMDVNLGAERANFSPQATTAPINTTKIMDVNVGAERSNIEPTSYTQSLATAPTTQAPEGSAERYAARDAAWQQYAQTPTQTAVGQTVTGVVSPISLPTEPTVPQDQRGTPEELSQWYMQEFLRDPTKMPLPTDALGKTQYDIAREGVEADWQAQLDRDMEAFRGQLAAQGITGPAAEQMVAEMRRDYTKGRLRDVAGVTGQELSDQYDWAKTGTLAALSTASGMNLLGRQLSSDEKLAQWDNETQIAVQKLRNTGAMNLQDAQNEWATNQKMKSEAGFNEGAKAAQGDERFIKTAEQLRSEGYDESYIWAYRAGVSGMGVEDFQNRAQMLSNVTMAGMLGDVNPVEITQIIQQLEIILAGGTPQLEYGPLNPDIDFEPINPALL